MNFEHLTIRDVKARAVVSPIARPVRTAVGAIPAAPLVLIDVTTEQGITGRAYLFGYQPATLVPMVKLIEELAPDMKGKAVVPFERMREFDLRFKLVGLQGLIAMVVSGLDMALWDILGQAADQPVARLLGGTPKPLKAYDSYGIVDIRADEKHMLQSLERGFKAIKIKIGAGDLSQDVEAVRWARELIGPDIALMVDYNQSQDPAEAIRRIERLAEFDLHWVEEPVSAQDLQGHARVRKASPVRIQTGENWWLPRDVQRSIDAGASDFAMPDIMKIGGVTGWLGAAALADAASLPLSSHIFVEASAHVLAITPTFHWLEYLDFAGGIMEEPIEVVDGCVTARGPGLGMVWNERAVDQHTL
ncbi:mandelate racemase [Agrobacterium tumefaciens]|uniref:enolase C-terminal domain-like protein n=1 Tax=Agrobacterium tumefaciens TaxID=358 RepID=UPI0015732ACB|nr:enolase C-terminal domain-like protein [Agrobacterium tumefaciens]NTB96045.1 mandelate racemase [Agrobacterium tumefaciens]NTC42976.1 mandelate racemase [Agrobacterium tumefaciens]